MTNYDWEIRINPKKRTRIMNYEVSKKRDNIILHSRKSKKGGATIQKFNEDALTILDDVFIEAIINAGSADDWIKSQTELYEKGPKINGVPLLGWSPGFCEYVKKRIKQGSVVR